MSKTNNDKKCGIHNSCYELIGDDQICEQNCLICYDCLKSTNTQHKCQGINHKTISIQEIKLVFNKIKQFSHFNIKQCQNKLNQYINKFTQHIIKQIQKQKNRLLKNIYQITLSQITKQQQQLHILQNLLNQQYYNLKCKQVNKISKKLFSFVPSKISKGFQKFNQYLDSKSKILQPSVNQLLKNSNYLSIVLKDVNQGINYPIFYQSQPQPQPQPQPEPQPLPVQLTKSKIGTTTEPSSPSNKKTVKDKDRSAVKQKVVETLPKNYFDSREYTSKYKNPFQFRGSEIIKSKDDIMFLQKLFQIKVIDSRLLYRASESNYSIKRFHTSCDGQASTIVFVRTQFNKIIGGYTPIPWKSTNNTIHSDIKKQSFLFSITLKQKMQLLDQKSAIFNSKNYGPTFGNGADLAICQNSNTQNTSYSQFPFSYGNPRYVQNNQHTTFLFTGQQQGNHFLIKQWEVWKLDICNQ